MPRNTAGTMVPPGSYPPASGQLISLDDYKALAQDIINEMTDSLSRSGKGDMLDQLGVVDGTASQPGLTFAQEPSSGLSRYAAGDVRLSVLGSLVARFIAAGLEVTGTVKSTGGLADDTSHGNRGNGALHSQVTQSVNGFMSSADKAKLDNAVIGVCTASLSGTTVTFKRNMGTVTHNSTGNWSFNFATVQPDTQYAVMCTAGDAQNIDFHVLNKTTTGFNVTMNYDSGVSTDCVFDVVVLR